VGGRAARVEIGALTNWSDVSLWRLLSPGSPGRRACGATLTHPSAEVAAGRPEPRWTNTTPASASPT